MQETFGKTIVENKWKRDKKTERGLRSGYGGEGDGERLGGRQQESSGQQSLRATSRVLLRKAGKKPDVL